MIHTETKAELYKRLYKKWVGEDYAEGQPTPMDDPMFNVVLDAIEIFQDIENEGVMGELFSEKPG